MRIIAAIDLLAVLDEPDPTDWVCEFLGLCG